MRGNENGRQQGSWRIEGREGGGAGWEGASPPPTTEGGEDGENKDHREGGWGIGGGRLYWKIATAWVCAAIGGM